APRIHGELLKLGFEISESTVSRYLGQGTSPRDSGQRWLTFLKNHREALAAMEFFTVPTATFRVLYCFFVIAHGRRKILHFNVTEHATCACIVQQLREAVLEEHPASADCTIAPNGKPPPEGWLLEAATPLAVSLSMESKSRTSGESNPQIRPHLPGIPLR